MHREEVICEEPLLTVDRQMGLNIVHPEGKVCEQSVKEVLLDLILVSASKNSIQSCSV